MSGASCSTSYMGFLDDHSLETYVETYTDNVTSSYHITSGGSQQITF